MSKRDVKLFVTDILEAIGKVERYTVSFTFEQVEKEAGSLQNNFI